MFDYLKVNGIDFAEPYSYFKNLNDEYKAAYPPIFNLPEGSKYKSNILKYKKDYTGLHPTQKPVALLEDIINTFSREGDTVADLTAGSGSTGVACENTGRNSILIEKEQKYYDIILNRLYPDLF